MFLKRGILKVLYFLSSLNKLDTMTKRTKQVSIIAIQKYPALRLIQAKVLPMKFQG